MRSPSVSVRLLRTQSDARLVELARAGHERAFEALVERYRRALLGYCRRQLLPHERAEDALQQGLLQAWLALREGVEVRHARPWLYSIVHNTALNMPSGGAAGSEPSVPSHASADGWEQAKETPNAAAPESVGEGDQGGADADSERQHDATGSDSRNQEASGGSGDGSHRDTTGGGAGGDGSAGDRATTGSATPGAGKAGDEQPPASPSGD